ncbi:MAG: SAM-dependent methyltransferase [Ruminococcus sp.]|nr:SAM-dependent methyltransferase [Ruminococcus sp.]
MNIKFLAEYIKHPKTVGAVAPSSKYLAEKMLENIDFENCSAIAEYGAGTGIFTAEVIRHKKKDTKFLVIERNERFYRILRRKFAKCSNVFVINGNAQDLRKYMKMCGAYPVDYIISGLPFASLPHDISDRILAETKKIIAESGGKFITFQYTLFKRKLFERFFDIDDISVAIRNIPPAFVLTMTSKQR